MPTQTQLRAENASLKALLSDREAILRDREALVRLQNEQIQKLEALNRWYAEQLKLSRAKKFGASSEQSRYEMPEQLSIFNEAEAERPTLSPEPTVETVTYQRKKPRRRDEAFENLPVETVEYTLPESEQTCQKCGGALHVMSKEIRKELKIVPAQVSVIEHVKYIYACRGCEKSDTSTPIIVAPAPRALLPKSLVSPGLLAYILHQKFVNAMPLNRQEQEFRRLGVLLSRQTLANWTLQGAALLEPLLKRLKEELLNNDVLHADETTLEVLCEPDRPAQVQSYMWLYRTSGCAEHPIVLYDYQEGRSGLFAKEFLKGFRGYLHTDGWKGYEKVEAEGVTLCGCWAHARRKFDEALRVCKNVTADSPEAVGVAFCDRLFKLEEPKKDENGNKIPLSPEDRLALRRKKSVRYANAFFAWVEKQSRKTLPKSLLGEALTYAQNQKKHLLAFLEDGRIELSNNRAERSIKPFVIDRKNWLFCNTPAGARSSAVVYSLVQTATENGLKPREYLEYVFGRIQLHGKEDVERLLPWAEEIPQECRMPVRVGGAA